MSEQARDPEVGTGDAGRDALDRRQRDGAAGTGDMLGGLSTGAGGTLGVGDVDEDFEPGPISGHQHDLTEAEPRIDSATTVHSVANLPAEGA